MYHTPAVGGADIAACEGSHHNVLHSSSKYVYAYTEYNVGVYVLVASKYNKTACWQIWLADDLVFSAGGACFLMVVFITTVFYF